MWWVKSEYASTNQLIDGAIFIMIQGIYSNLLRAYGIHPVTWKSVHYLLQSRGEAWWRVNTCSHNPVSLMVVHCNLCSKGKDWWWVSCHHPVSTQESRFQPKLVWMFIKLLHWCLGLVDYCRPSIDHKQTLASSTSFWHSALRFETIHIFPSLVTQYHNYRLSAVLGLC